MQRASRTSRQPVCVRRVASSTNVPGRWRRPAATVKPVGPSRKLPAARSRIAPKTLRPSGRGRQSHSILPAGETRAFTSQSERNAYSAIGGNGLSAGEIWVAAVPAATAACWPSPDPARMPWRGGAPPNSSSPFAGCSFATRLPSPSRSLELRLRSYQHIPDRSNTPSSLVAQRTTKTGDSARCEILVDDAACWPAVRESLGPVAPRSDDRVTWASSRDRPYVGASRLVFVLPLARRRILVDAGQLARRGILEDLVCLLEVPFFRTAVPAVPDEVADDREDNHDNKEDKLHPEVHVALLSMIAAVPYATTSVMVW